MVVNEMHLRRVIDEHITTLLNFPANAYGSMITGATLPEQEAAILRLKCYTSDTIEACDKLGKLVSELHIASSLKVATPKT
jgi:hypothetical protein